MKQNPKDMIPAIADLAEVCGLVALFITPKDREVTIDEISFPAALCRLAAHFGTTPWDLVEEAQERASKGAEL